jgi:hypothetical protein
MKTAQIARDLWKCLWEDYRRRVPYARIYQQIVEEAGGAIANDHIAFRSLRLTREEINLGIPYLETLVKALGYELAGEYHFRDRFLYARHYRHPEQDAFELPKLFISELIVEALPDTIIEQIKETVASGDFFDFNRLDFTAKDAIAFLHSVFTRPWQPPKRSIVESVNQVSQYGAWVLLHGYSVNHFTGYVNRQNTPQYADIESTARALSDRGIPMKKAIEGSKGSGLRQTATQAVTEMVTVLEERTGELVQIPWTYAYYEIAERNYIEVSSGQKVWFEGFLDAQAQNLFEMTRKD